MSNRQEHRELDLSRYSTGDYDPGPFWKRIVWIFVSRVIYETRFPWPSTIKSIVLRRFGASVGIGVVWKPDVKIKYPWFLAVGDHCWIGEDVWIDNVARVDLGDHVVLSQSAYLLTGNHDYKSPTFDLMAKPVRIGSGAWIGARGVVCPGVDVGEMSVLGVGSVATHNLESDGIYHGNPAVKVRERVLEGRDSMPES